MDAEHGPNTKPTLVMVDDFLHNPTAITGTLKKGDFAANNRAPGVESLRDGYQEDWVGSELSRLVKSNIVSPTGKFGILRLITAADKVPLVNIHVDPYEWAGLLYLTQPKYCKGGTSFYRYKPTGWDSAPSPVELKVAGFKDLDDFIIKSSKSQSRWEEIMQVPMKFNRLIVYRANQFHAATPEGKNKNPGFGKGLKNGRLTMNFFFDSA